MKTIIQAAAFSIFLPTAALAPGLVSAMGFESGGEEKATYSRGFDLAMAGDYAKAIEILQAVIDLDPDDADAWNMLGFSYRNTGQSDHAWNAYEQALTLNPGHKGAHEYIGEWYLIQGDIPSAQAQLEKLRTLCPDGCPEAKTLTTSIENALKS
jgi:tetratricopeptide (TPR) repeat protein